MTSAASVLSDMSATLQKPCWTLTRSSGGSAEDMSFLHPLFFSSVSFLISSVPIHLLLAPPHLCSTHFLSFSFLFLFLLLPSQDSSPSVCPAPALSTVYIQCHSINQSIHPSINRSIDQSVKLVMMITFSMTWAAHGHLREQLQPSLVTYNRRICCHDEFSLG